jgi:hypothetical protein
VATGDLLSAQKIILGEVQSQVGGAAAASGHGRREVAAVASATSRSQIGTALLPVIDKVAVFFTTTFIPALYKLPPFFAKVKTFLAPAIATFQAFFQGHR